MLVRAKAPLRIGLAGGGTDVSPYSELFGGTVLNTTINLFAYAILKPRTDGKIILNCVDCGERCEFPAREFLDPDGKSNLLKGVYNRVVKDFTKKPLAFELHTYVDAPPGSGLGSSSTLVVAILGAFTEWLLLPLGEYDIAYLAYQIEREDLLLSGGKQDQYAATFGGFNFMEFHSNNKVIVNPLRIKQDYINELEFNLLLIYTGQSRLSSDIIEEQTSRIVQKQLKALEATHELKRQAVTLKEALLQGNLDRIGEILDFGWQHKQRIADRISNPALQEIYQTALQAGATGGKITGAGGGGFFVFYCPGNSRFRVIEALKPFNGDLQRFQFTKRGLITWKSGH